MVRSWDVRDIHSARRLARCSDDFNMLICSVESNGQVKKVREVELEIKNLQIL